MADSFFGFDTSVSNLNDDEGGGEPFEDEYDALNDETFGQAGDFDWEVEHEHLAEQLESSRRHNTSSELEQAAASDQLEASLSQLVLDDTDIPQSRPSISSLWGVGPITASAPTPVPTLKNVCTVEELERQLRQKQMQQQKSAIANQASNKSFFQPRFPPVILQRPPSLQAQVSLPFASQQSMTNMNQMTQPVNKIIGQNNQLNQSNLMQNQLGQNLNQLSQPVNQLGQNVNQLSQSQLNPLSHNQFLQSNQMGNFQNNQMVQGNLMNMQQNMQIVQSNQLLQNQLNQNLCQLNQNSQNVNHLVQNMTQLGQNPQNTNQMGQNINQLTQNLSQIGQNTQNVNPLGQNMNQLAQNMNQLTQNAQNVNHMGQNLNHLGQNMNQLTQNAQNVNHLGQNINHLGQTMNQLTQNAQNVNPMGQNINQLSQSMNQLSQNTSNIGQMGQPMNPLVQNMNQLSQNTANVSQMGQTLNPLPQNMTQLTQSNQNMNQMMPNGSQFGPGVNQGMNQFHMMNQQRMMPPPGMGMPRQNFNQNLPPQYNLNFRGPVTSKPEQPMNQQNMLLNQQLMQQQLKNQSPHNQNMKMNQQQRTQSPKPGQSQPKLNQNQPPQNQMHHNQLGQNQLLNSNQLGQNQLAQNQLGPNQLAQNQLNQNHMTQNTAVQKPQKSRVYCNSQNTQIPNLTSQNMVQLIQNTHPMLNTNFSMYHNVSHHPILNNRNVFNNVLNNHPMFNQRHNGTFNSVNRNVMNGDDDSITSDTDEYAGLMTQREKQWLINIQMLQLNTGTPYIHDFYYTVFLERQQRKEKEGVKEAHKANQQNHPFYSGGVKQEIQSQHTRERHNSHRHNSTSEDAAAPRTYVPAQFENSLGKLQCGSVTAPRKIIDVEVVGGEPPSGRTSRAASVASTTHPAEVPREMKRTKQLLLDIEALYTILLRLEELSDPLAISNALILKEREEKQKQLEAAQKEALEAEQEEDTNLFLKNIESVQRRPKQDSPKNENVDKRQVVNLASNQKPTPVKNLLDEDKDELVNKMFAGLLHSDRLPQLIIVRKGRSLLARFLSRVSGSHPRLRMLWSRVLRALPSAARRDDGSLSQLAQHYRKYIQNTTGWPAILESCGLLSEALDPARTPHALTSSLTLSCVCSLIEKASTLVNTPEATSNERQWSKFVKTLARALKNTSLTVAKPVQPLAEPKLRFHLKQLDSRSTIEILQRGRSAAEFADLSKADVTEQLVKHLC